MTNPHLKEVKRATILRFTDLWRTNFQANLPAIQRNPGVQSLKKKFRDVPCFVIGAGPSLDKNLHYLREAADKSLIIASDAAFKPLLKYDLTPSLVVCLDPQEDIIKFLTGVSHRGITLVVPTVVHPKVIDVWEGNLVFYNKYAPDIPILTQIQNQLPQMGILTPGGSVLSVAYDLAFQSGGSPIFFLGQDLSYPKKNTYSRASENAEQGLDETVDRQESNIVFETDIHGEQVPTLKSMSVSKQWFNWAFTTWKRENPAQIINCSESGILTDHLSLMTLQEAIFRFCRKKINVAWQLKKALK